MSSSSISNRQGERLAVVLASSVVSALMLSACDGDRAAPSRVTAPSSIAVPAQASVVAVQATLPAGASQDRKAFTVSNSIGAVSAGAAGSFSLPVFGEGAQYAELKDGSGTVLAVGFVSSATPTLDATSTAKALLYFAAAFYRLPSPYRGQMIEAVAGVNGFASVVTAVEKAILAGGINSKSGAPLIAAALATFVTAFYDPANAIPAATGRQQAALLRSVKSILVNPSGAQSGMTVINDSGPDGVHFMNAYRRLATAYFDEVSYTDAQGVHAKPVTNVVPPLQIPAVIGLSNVSGSLVAAAQAAGTLSTGGTADSAYTPISTASTALALEPNSTKTSYKVTVIGAGLPTGAALTAEQSSAQRILVVTQLLRDYIVPIVYSIVIPAASSKIDDFFKFDGANAALSDLAATLLSSAPQIYELMNAGSVGDALTLAMNTVATSNTLQAVLLQFVKNGVSYFAGASTASVATSLGMDLLQALNILSGALVSADVAVLTAQIAASHSGDAFAVDVAGTKVVLSPLAATVPQNGTQTFTVTVPSATDSGQTVVYHWSTAASAGHLADGKPGHRDDFDSTSNTATYTANADARGTDTVTAAAFYISGQDRIPIGSKDAVVTIANTNYTLFGGPGGYDCGATMPGGGINSDDSLTVYLNGTQVFYTSGAYCSGLASIPLPGAKKGDTVRMVVADEFGHHSGLNSIYMLDPATQQYVMVLAGFNISTPDGKNNGVQFDKSFAIPF